MLRGGLQAIFKKSAINSQHIIIWRQAKNGSF